MATKSVVRDDDTRPHGVLIGTLRTVGDLGPAYQVLSVDSGTLATIIVLESEETLQYPIAKILTDPEA
jgi:hypothetical protein